MTQPQLLEQAIVTEDLNVSINEQTILENINTHFPQTNISTIIGPSGSGKSTLLRCINQIGRLSENYRETGRIKYFGKERKVIYPSIETLRQAVGMVFQSPCIYPTSIIKNVLFGVEKISNYSKSEKESKVEEALRSTSLWNEVKDRLNKPAQALSLGQRQRLCLARVLIMKPDIILLDEPTASLDPRSCKVIEELLLELKRKYSILLVTHDIPQVNRIADHIVFIEDGRLIQEGPAASLLSEIKYQELDNAFEQIKGL